MEQAKHVGRGFRRRHDFVDKMLEEAENVSDDTHGALFEVGVLDNPETTSKRRRERGTQEKY